jgi:hypothetical protein
MPVVVSAAYIHFVFPAPRRSIANAAGVLNPGSDFGDATTTQ